jgi:hypothetical protein
MFRITVARYTEADNRRRRREVHRGENASRSVRGVGRANGLTVWAHPAEDDLEQSMQALR